MLAHRVLTSACCLPFKEEEVEGAREVTIIDFVATAPADIGATLALARDHVAVVIVSATGVAVTRLAPVRVVQREPVVLILTLVAVSANHKAFAGTISRFLIAAIV